MMVIPGLVAGYLKSGKLAQFESLESVCDQVAFLFAEEAHFPMIQGIKRSNREKNNKDEETMGKSKVMSKAMRDAGNKAFG